MSEQRKIAASAGVVAASTLLSRILGLVRDIVMSSRFGTGMVAEAFYVAFMIPNLLRRLVGEGSLTVAFISVFTKLRAEKGEEEARRFMEGFWTLMSAVLCVMSLLGIIFARPIVTLFTNPAFRAETAQFDLAVKMTALMFPYLFLIGLVALAMGILNSYKKFFAPAFHPVLLNLSWIACVLLLHSRLGERGMNIIAGVLLGGVLQLGLQIPFLVKTGMRFLPRLDLKNPAVRRIGKLMIPSSFAIGIVQVNTLIANYFITAFPGARSQFYYANRFVEFSYGIFSLAVATAVLPTLSEHAGRGDKEQFADSLGFGLRLVAFIIIPSSIGLALIGKPLIHVVLEHGRFTSADTAHASAMLVMFCLGLWGIAGLRIVAQAYYAVEDMTTPLWSAAFAMFVNLAGCWAFSRWLGRAGVPLAIALSAVVNFICLSLLLKRKVVSLDWRGVALSSGKSALASIPMAGIAWFGASMHLWTRPGQTALKVLVLAAVVGAAAAGFALVSLMLKSEELQVVIDTVKGRLLRRG